MTVNGKCFQVYGTFVQYLQLRRLRKRVGVKAQAITSRRAQNSTSGSKKTVPKKNLAFIQAILRVGFVGCGLLVPVFQERGTGLFRVVGTGPGQAPSMRCPTRTKCCALTRRGLPER